jgi:hypothetical protein
MIPETERPPQLRRPVCLGYGKYGASERQGPLGADGSTKAFRIDPLYSIWIPRSDGNRDLARLVCN